MYKVLKCNCIKAAHLVKQSLFERITEHFHDRKTQLYFSRPPQRCSVKLQCLVVESLNIISLRMETNITVVAGVFKEFYF